MPDHRVLKVTTAWGGFGYAKVAEANNRYGWSGWVWDQHAWLVELLSKFGIHGWADFAGMMAGLYSTVVLLEYLWKKWKGRHESV